MNVNIFKQALQILLYKDVQGWGDKAFEYKLATAFLIFNAIMLYSIAGSEVPDLNKSDKRFGVIVDVLDGRGRRGGRTLFLNEGGEIKGYPARGFSDSELKPFIGHEATLSTYDVSIVPFVSTTSVLAIAADGQPTIDRTRDVQRNANRFDGGFRFFAKALLFVELCLYLNLVHKLFKGKIILNGKNFIWVPQ